MRLTAALVVSAAGCLGFSPLAEKPDVDDVDKVAAYIQPSVVNLRSVWTGYVYDDHNRKYLKNGETFTFETNCSGFAVSPDGYLATAGHCVIQGSDIAQNLKVQAANWALQNNYYDKSASTMAPEDIAKDYRVVDANGKDGVLPSVWAAWGITSGGTETGKWYSAQVVQQQYYAAGDAALLKIDASDLQALTISRTKPSVGDRIVASGDVKLRDITAEPAFSPTIQDGTVKSKTSSHYETSTEFRNGMDGGPAVNLRHEVVGFVAYMWDTSTNVYGYRHVRPASHLTELLKKAGVKNEPGSIGREYFRGLDAYFDGDRNDAVQSFQDVLAEQPGNTMAKKYLTRAKALDSGGLQGVLGLPLLALIVLVGLGGGGYAIVRARRRGIRLSISSALPKRRPREPAESPGRIFISYRQKDSAYSTSWLFDRLTERFGAEQVFKDVDSIGLGDDFVEAINEAVGSCDVLLAVIGAEWLSVTDDEGKRRLDDPDDFVRLEIEAALDRKVLLIPILIDGVHMPSQRDLPPSIASLSRRQALEVSPHRFRADTDRLLDVVEHTLRSLREKQPPGAHPDAPLAEAIAATDAADPAEPPAQ